MTAFAGTLGGLVNHFLHLRFPERVTGGAPLLRVFGHATGHGDARALHLLRSSCALVCRVWWCMRLLCVVLVMLVRGRHWYALALLVLM